MIYDDEIYSADNTIYNGIIFASTLNAHLQLLNISVLYKAVCLFIFLQKALYSR